jgi:diaminohydroxyphosphoribosylaminopyrimidine deaminase / 5-amino-6-(5-phosphoribosylamino)uracil reductase
LTATADTRDAADHGFMQLALGMARRGLGATAPNPSVGAVVVDPATGEVIARGWTQPGGRPHAETEALRRAGPRARGATMYVTLEPCSHYGKTPPCARAIIEAGVSRVVAGILDPDPRVAGRGIDMLRDAGIEVRRGVCAAEADRVTRGHILRVTERRPLIQIKMALDASGQVARGAGGKPRWVTGPIARAHGHLLRARADAILVGSRTVADDDPELTCRLPGLLGRSPIRVILCGSTLPAPESKMVRSARDVPVWVFSGPGADATQQNDLARAGCRLFRVATVNGRPWIPAVTEALVAEGITRLLVEGGPAVSRAFSSAGLVDDIVQYRAAGDRDAATARQDALESVSELPGHLAFALAHERALGDDMLYVFHRMRGS